SPSTAPDCRSASAILHRSRRPARARSPARRGKEGADEPVAAPARAGGALRRVRGGRGCAVDGAGVGAARSRRGRAQALGRARRAHARALPRAQPRGAGAPRAQHARGPRVPARALAARDRARARRSRAVPRRGAADRARARRHVLGVPALPGAGRAPPARGAPQGPSQPRAVQLRARSDGDARARGGVRGRLQPRARRVRVPMSARPFDPAHVGSLDLRSARAAFEYALAVPRDARRALARGWLALGVLALLAAGLFSLLLVLARAPYTQALMPWPGLFRTALVVHVDLSVLVWFIAFGGALWSLNSSTRWLRLGWAALGLALLGTALMAGAPFAGEAEALMSNYIPVVRQPVFLAGLVVFAAGAALLVLRAMGAIPPVGRYVTGAGALRFGLNTAAVATFLALAAFAASYLGLPRGLNGQAYYELLFWGGGHVLQFGYTQLMLVAWLWLASASDLRLSASPRVTLVLFALGLAAVFTVPVIYLAFPVGSP